MKRIFPIQWLAAAALLVAATACVGDASKNSYTEVGKTFYCLTTDTSQPQAAPKGHTASGVVSIADGYKTMKLTLAFPIDATTQVTLTTDDMPLTQAGRTGSFTFRSTQVDAGAHQVTELSGFFDDFGPIFVDATIDNRYQVRLTSAPTLFGYTATAVSTEKGEHPSLTSTSVAYQLTLNHNTGKATLIIDPFQLEDKGEVTRMLQIPDIAFSINANGYHLTKDIVEPRTEQGRIPALTITNLDIDVSQNGRYIQGGFYCDGHYMSLLGRMVPSTDILVN